jgi:hypothetical protein
VCPVNNTSQAIDQGLWRSTNEELRHASLPTLVQRMDEYVPSQRLHSAGKGALAGRATSETHMRHSLELFFMENQNGWVLYGLPMQLQEPLPE